MKRRNIHSEKVILEIIVVGGFLTFLMALTLSLYAFMTIIFESKDIYIVGIAAGITGAFWSQGIKVLDKFREEIKKENKWFSRREYKKYVRNWFIIYILSVFWFAILWILIHRK